MKKYILNGSILLVIILALLISFETKAQIGIHFTMANGEVTTNGIDQFYEFDIYAQATASSQFYIAQVYIDYNTDAFGTSIYANGNVTSTEGPLLANVLGPNGDFGSYTVDLNDNIPSKLAVSNIWSKFDNGGGDEGYELSNTLDINPQVYVHLAIKIQDPSQSSGLTFDENVIQIELQQYYFTTPGSNATANYDPVTFGAGLNDPLPVELTSFTADIKDMNVILKWQTETEVNNYGFDIERAINSDTKDWKKIGFVAGNGNSNSVKNYTFVDKNLIGGNSFSYRLKQLDTDGTFEYSDEVNIEFQPTEFSLYQNYPNPFNPSTTINFTIPQSSPVSIKVYNVEGEEVAELVNGDFEAGTHSIKFAAPGLSSGIYFYTIIAGDFSESKKMMLLK